MEKWTDKVALVTGASSGIGKAICEELVNHGVKVVGLARRIDKLKVKWISESSPKKGFLSLSKQFFNKKFNYFQAIADELKTRPGKFMPLQCDLSNEMEVMRSMEWIEKNMGGVMILINCAAIKTIQTFMNGGIDEWKQTMDVNVMGTILLTKKVLQLMKKKGKFLAFSLIKVHFTTEQNCRHWQRYDHDY